MRPFIILVLAGLFTLSTGCRRYGITLLSDDFSSLDTGLFSAPVGPHTEYHYLPEAGIKGNWTVSSFASGGNWGTAWQVRQENGRNVMCQTIENKNRSTHPMIISGDSLWDDYRLKVTFSPEDNSQCSGVAFRYHNDRCFYFFGIKDSAAVLSVFRHADKMNSLNETILAKEAFHFTPGDGLTAEVTVNGNVIRAKLNDLNMPEVTDDTWPKGKIGLISNSRAVYSSVEVLTGRGEFEESEALKELYEKETQKFQAGNPSMVVWKKIKTTGFGVGRNLRFGDLDGDGQKDVLIGQVVHHNWPRDSHSELSCLTAMTLDGKILWQKGSPDPEKNHLTNDVGFQIHDLDNDGKNEVIYCMNFEIIVADASTGKTAAESFIPKK